MIVEPGLFSPGGTEADAVISNDQRQGRRQDVQFNRYRMGLGMTGNVGQPFLHHAVTKQGHRA